MDEIMLLLKSLRDKVNDERRFLAAMQGIDLNEQQEDVADFKDYQAGFGVGMGLGYESDGE